MRVLNFRVLNTDLTLAGFLENSQSVIYAPEFRNKGSFTIKCPATAENLDLLQVGRFLARLDDENFCIIRAVAYTDNIDDKTMTITGCFGNGILEQRIVYDKTDITETTENTIRTLITNNLITPTDTDRAYPNFVLGTAITTADSITGNYYKKNLLTAINELVTGTNYGFKTIISNNQFVFTLVAGVDRTLTQTTNNRVIFSDKWDNLLENEYIKSLELYKNVVLVLGEGDGETQLTTVVGAGQGVDRYEGVVDATAISTENGTITAEDYAELLKTAGIAGMALETDSFLGNVLLGGGFIYRTDFAMGDIVTLENSKIGVSADLRIIGMTETEDNSGYNIVPILGVETETSDTATTVSGEVLTRVYTKDIVDTLISEATKKPLSANQGKVLDGKITANATAINTLDSTVLGHTSDIAELQSKALNKVTATNILGQSVTVQNTAIGYVDQIGIEGNTIGGGGTPEVPIAIQSVASPVGMGVCGKNVFDFSQQPFVKGNTTGYQHIENGIKVYPDTFTTGYTYLNICKMSVNAGERYTLSATGNSLNIASPVVAVRDSITNGWITEIKIVNTYKELSFIAPQSGKIHLQLNIGTSAPIGSYCDFTNIQVEKSTTATAYEAYQGTTISVPIKDLNGNTLPLQRISSTVYDSVYMQGEKGYHKKMINTVILDGSADEGWSLQSINEYGIANFYIQSLLINTAVTALERGKSNRFVTQNTMIGQTTTAGMYFANTNTFYIRIQSTTASTVADLKTWLASNPTTVIYASATPMITECHADTAIALESVPTYKGTTNIYSTNAVQPYFDVTELAMGIGNKQYVMLADNDGNPLMPVTEAENVLMRDGRTAQMVYDQIKILTGTTAPTSATSGYIGQMYIDTVTQLLYICIANGVWVKITTTTI